MSETAILPSVHSTPARNRAGHWLPGVSGNTSGRIIPGNKEVTALARANSLLAMEKLIELMSDPDTRVAYMSITAVLERAYGKPKDYDPKEDAPPTLDLLKLSAEQRQQLSYLLNVARAERLTADTQSAEQADISVDNQQVGSSNG